MKLCPCCGGTSSVHLARDVVHAQRWAIRILRSDLALKPVCKERFLREGLAVKRLHHPNLVAITDVGEDPGVVFLAMEYFEAVPLRTMLAAGPLRMIRALRIAAQGAPIIASSRCAGSRGRTSSDPGSSRRRSAGPLSRTARRAPSDDSEEAP